MSKKKKLILTIVSSIVTAILAYYGYEPSQVAEEGVKETVIDVVKDIAL